MSFFKKITIGLLLGLTALMPLSASAALTTSLVSYWKLDESSGNASDSVASNTLTNLNTTTYTAAKINNGAHFVRTSSQTLRITDGSQSGLDITGDISIHAWIKATTLPGNMAIVSKDGGASQNGQFLYVEADGSLTFEYYSSDGTRTYSHTNTTPISTGTLYDVVVSVVVATQSVSFYVNGSSVSTNTSITNASSIQNNTADFRIGSRGDGSLYFNGDIDEVGIWSRALSASEVSALYNGGAGLPYPLAQAATYADWQFFPF